MGQHIFRRSIDHIEGQRRNVHALKHGVAFIRILER